MTTQEKTEFWGVLEIFGHTKFAGLIGETTLGGCSFVRIDVPEIPAEEEGVGVERRVIREKVPGFTKLYGQAAIFSIGPTTEEIARGIAATMRARPITVYDLPRDPQRALPIGCDDDEPDDAYDDRGR